MTQPYTMPGVNTGYVPRLHEQLLVEYSLSPAMFPINSYVNTRKVEEMRGYWIKMQNDDQGRVVDPKDFAFPDGQNRPQTTYGNDGYTFPPFECVRTQVSKRYGFLSVAQSKWDLLDQGARLAAQQLMTLRTYNVHQTLTTSGNWPTSNYDTATSLGGGVWSAADATHPYIRKSIMAALNIITKQTYGSVKPKDCYLVFNPNVAKVVATSQEFLDFIKQNPVSIPIWENDPQFQLYGLPSKLVGCNLVVDGTTYNSAGPNEVTPASAKTLAFTLSDSYAVILTKQQAVQPSVGSSFSTVEMFTYQDLEPFEFEDVRNKYWEIAVEQNVDTSSNIIVAGESGMLIKIDS